MTQAGSARTMDVVGHSHMGERRANSGGDAQFDRVAWSWRLFVLAVLSALVSYVSYVALIRA